MAGKYAHVINKLPRLLGTEPKYQEKVEAVKAEMLNPCDCEATGHLDKPKQHGADDHAKNCNSLLKPRSFIPASDLTRQYVGIRTEIDDIERLLSEANLRLEATSQLMTDQFEVEGVESLRVSGLGSVRTQYEPYAKVENKDSFRHWCIDVCQTCNQPKAAHPFAGIENPDVDEGGWLIAPCHKPATLEASLSLPWQSTNAIVKERLLAGFPEPPGVTCHAKVKIVLTRDK